MLVPTPIYLQTFDSNGQLREPGREWLRAAAFVLWVALGISVPVFA